MPVYMIIESEVHDQEMYNEYIERVRPILEKYNARYLSRGGKITALSKNWFPERIILVEFDSNDDIKKCFESDEYAEISHLRENSVTSKAILVEGTVD